MGRSLYSLLALLLSFSCDTVFAGTVKKSFSGICHPPSSSYYERTQSFQAFDSVQACLTSGGRLPYRLNEVISARTEDGSGPYQRSAFGPGWNDSDGDCQNSRAEALIATSSTSVRFASDQNCRVVSGRWVSPFTGQVIQNSSKIDIDHVVPLAWAWEHGAAEWADSKRQQFANNPVNLLPVEAGLNRSKGALGPDQWLPPTGQCGYVARFTRIVKLYELQPTKSEARWPRDFLDTCRS